MFGDYESVGSSLVGGFFISRHGLDVFSVRGEGEEA
jgi:hypothetical protein